jgi:nicotinamidase/pyrazinamidase
VDSESQDLCLGETAFDVLDHGDPAHPRHGKIKQQQIGVMFFDRTNSLQTVPVLNRWVDAALVLKAPVYASRDWHPLAHVSFKEQGGEWPPHCLQDSEGARFHSDLKLPDSVVKITKGVRFDQDQNSVFDQTGLAVRLKRDGVKRLLVGGLALDVCVLASIMDGIKEGFVVRLLKEATRPVKPESGQQAIKEMKAAGALIVDNI